MSDLMSEKPAPPKQLPRPDGIANFFWHLQDLYHELKPCRRLTRLSETTSKDLIISTTDLFGDDSLVSGRKIILILGAFIGYLKHRKPSIYQAEVSDQPS